MWPSRMCTQGSHTVFQVLLSGTPTVSLTLRLSQHSKVQGTSGRRTRAGGIKSLQEQIRQRQSCGTGQGLSVSRFLSETCLWLITNSKAVEAAQLMETVGSEFQYQVRVKVTTAGINYTHSHPFSYPGQLWKLDTLGTQVLICLKKDARLLIYKQPAA